ncbi:hypothetical protein B7H23_07690 [Notoacmeibacter marinus]|uniref:Uncharacterized protein n=1 Tax=Notoacmeibacter marinus TaxID=1876515 RepID=A0A231V575_9HYPH|nr:hypothetical protein [Notoacmeibacter marinus]OXT02746.1 hypothetical protein B7H23_07690 [Notoacmeibacter marinus]
MMAFDLKKLATEDPKKMEELAAFHWFSKMWDVEYDYLALSERPDFVMKRGEQSIGVEVTMAQRSLPGSAFPAYQIEAAQRQFAEELLKAVAPKLHLDIGLILNDEVAVDKPSAKRALGIVADLIDEVSGGMAGHSVELLVRAEDDISFSDHPKHVCPEIPAFLQHIQLFNDGQTFTSISGSRGGTVHDYTEDDLRSVLERKHDALRGYSQCDEQWLIIVAGQVPPIYLFEEPPKILLPSMASTFYGVSVPTPIDTDFDRVFFFKCPAEVTELTA